MTKTYDKQPDELPETLPAGTRGGHVIRDAVLRGEAKLGQGGLYWGDWRGVPSATGMHPANIDWTSVECPAPPERAKAPKLCTACGAPADAASFNDTHRSGWAGHRIELLRRLATAHLCKPCATGDNGPATRVAAAIAPRFAQPPPAPDPFGEEDRHCASCLESSDGRRARGTGGPTPSPPTGL
jgi:hypothetical protein